MQSVILAILCSGSLVPANRASAPPKCPDGTEQVDAFSINGTAWLACEDLQRLDGALALVPGTGDGEVEWFSKGYEPYVRGPDSEYYLNVSWQPSGKGKTLFGKAAVQAAFADILGAKLLDNSSFPQGVTLQLVTSAVPPLSATGTFVSSRSSTVDTTFGSMGEDANSYGFPTLCGYIDQGPCALNASSAAEGLLGGHLPVVRFVLPLINVPNATTSQFWEMVAMAAPDMGGSREQTVWFRYTQLECAGTDMTPPCRVLQAPQYWDTYWWSRAPAGSGRTTGEAGPINASTADGFYANLLEVRRWWRAELAAEGLMQLDLPSPASTNGTHLQTQALASLIRAMITRVDTWHPRYGVLPGYGLTMQNGFQDVFTTTAQAALEFGAMPWARGLIDHQFRHYIRPDGMIHYRGEELPQSARMLTILALYYSYAEDKHQASAFLLTHFPTAKAVADLLAYRRTLSLKFPENDPRHGMIPGDDEADNYNHHYVREFANHVIPVMIPPWHCHHAPPPNPFHCIPLILGIYSAYLHIAVSSASRGAFFFCCRRGLPRVRGAGRHLDPDRQQHGPC